MPVGTNATVKAADWNVLTQAGFNLVLSNTYHLYLRPGRELIKKAGGLRGFSGWQGNILTDSGGFQVFSLAPFRKILDHGIKFRSHIDGSYHVLDSRQIVDIQCDLGTDIMMQLDVCTPAGESEKKAKNAVILTARWAQESKDQWQKSFNPDRPQYLFPIIQGNFYPSLRKESAERAIELDLPGLAIGGLSVGETFSQFSDFLSQTAALLPDEKPRYVMGIGTPDFILEAVENGIDMFDCVFPTRVARNGSFMTADGMIAVKKEPFTEDFLPPDPECGCPVCKKHSRAYLKHLFKCNEIYGCMLATEHNLNFMKKLMDKTHEAILNNRFKDFKRDFLARYTGKH
jgi:queuine tRNA-ribosyltransferase